MKDRTEQRGKEWGIKGSEMGAEADISNERTNKESAGAGSKQRVRETLGRIIT